MTKIQWTEDVWNPIAGCSVLSPGCTNCYAMRMAWRLSRNPATPQYHGTVKLVNGKPVWTGVINRASDATLTAPLRRRKPTVWFVNSMSDLFHEDVPDEWIDRVFAVMALCPQHKFQVLTKRAARMRKYVNAVVDDRQRHTKWAARGTALARSIGQDRRVPPRWPLPNVWLGVSAEDQRRAEERIPLLLDTPAAVRFVSAEPLLGPIDFGRIAHENGVPEHYYAVLDGYVIDGSQSQVEQIDWIIVGGESGPGARPCNVEWIRDIVRQCRAAAVPVFCKQLGADPYEPRVDNDGNGCLSIHPPIPLNLRDRKGGDMAEWPADIRIREMPT